MRLDTCSGFHLSSVFFVIYFGYIIYSSSVKIHVHTYIILWYAYNERIPDAFLIIIKRRYVTNSINDNANEKLSITIK